MKSYLLEEALKNQRISHAYLLIGQRLEELKEEVLTFSKEILVKTIEEEKQWSSNNFPDFHWIKPENDQITIDKIRELNTFISKRPLSSKKKIIFIEEAHLLRNEGANALLKLLEEPPEYIIFLLTTHGERKLLPTIVSRCQKIYYYGRNREELNIPEEVFLEIMDGLLKKDLLILPKYFPEIEEMGDDFFEFLLFYFRDLLLVKEGVTEDLTLGFLDHYKKHKNISLNGLVHILKKIDEIMGSRRLNVNFRLSVEELLLYIMEEA